MPDANPRKISVDSLLDNTFTKPSKEEFEELEETDRKRSGLTSDLTMSQGRRYNDGKKGKMNINKNILPYDQTRVKMKSPINGVDYINASWISQPSNEKEYDSLRMHPYLPMENVGLVVSDSPNESSLDRFYTMIYQHDVDLILHISNDESYKNTSDMTVQGESSVDSSNVSRKLIKRVFVEDYLVKEDWDLSTKRGKTNKCVYVELKGLSLH